MIVWINAPEHFVPALIAAAVIVFAVCRFVRPE